MILDPLDSLNFFTKRFTSLSFRGTIQLSTTDTDLENEMKIVYGCLAVCLVALAAVPFVSVENDTQPVIESSTVIHTNGKISVKIDDNLHVNTNGTLGVQLGNICVSTTGVITTCI